MNLLKLDWIDQYGRITVGLVQIRLDTGEFCDGRRWLGINLALTVL